MADPEATKAATGPADDSKKPNTAPATTGAPTQASAPSARVPAPESALGSDIAKILESVKLPERRDNAAQHKAIENKAAAFDTTLGAPPAAAPTAAAGEKTPLPAATVMPKEAQAASGSLAAVHTLKNDLQSVVRDQKISVVRAVSLEQDRRAREKSDRFDTPAPTHSKRPWGVLLVSAVLLFLGAAALFGVYTVMQSSGAQEPSAQSASILFAENSVSYPLDNAAPEELKQRLASSIGSLQGALGSITAITPTISVQNADASSSVRPATFAEFMRAIGANPPEELLRALGGRFFFGVHVVDTNAPLFVIPLTSYDHAFAGMLAWEETLESDLSPVFPTVSSMTTDANNLPVNRNFTDDVMRNYDVRELKDDSGAVKLYYSFPSQNILIIAASPYSFAEILSRLQAARSL